VKKHLRAQDIARQTICPASTWSIQAVRFCRSRTRFSRRTAFWPHLYNQAQMSAQGIPQIAIVMGSCTGRRRLWSRRCRMKASSCVIRARSFSAGRRCEGGTGEVVTAEELGGADVHSRQSGVTDTMRRTTAMRSESHAASSPR